jgi:hypothetical protein
MADISTTLNTALKRATHSIIDDIAIEGLKLLHRVLEDSGFSRSEYLKNYEIYSNVFLDEIEFEIVLDIEAVISEDEMAQEALEQQQEEVEKLEKESQRYKFSRVTGRVYQMKDIRIPAKDARTSAKDARTPAKDARTTAYDRLVKHEIALRAPRSARVSRTGKLSVALRRSVRETEKKVEFPKDKFEGIIGDFMTRLEQLIAEVFVPEFNYLLLRYSIE